MTRVGSRYVHRRAAYELVVDGRTINPTVDPRLMSLTLTEKRGAEADELEIVLSDHDGKLDIPPAGATITLKLGWLDLTDGDATPQLVDKGTFKVDDRAHDGTPDRLTIRAKSADLTRGFRSRRSQTWTDTTLGAVLGDVATRNGLQAAVAADKGAIEVKHLVQGRESDAAFLSRLGRIHDAVATVKAGRLIFAAIGSGVTPQGSNLPGATITRRDGDRHRWQAAERDKNSGAVAEWHDRKTSRRSKVVVGSEENAKRLGRTFASEEAATRAAERHTKTAERKGAQFSLEMAHGDVSLFPERRVTVSGWKPEIDSASWLVVEVRHSVDAQGGLKSSLQLELGGSSARQARS